MRSLILFVFLIPLACSKSDKSQPDSDRLPAGTGWVCSSEADRCDRVLEAYPNAQRTSEAWCVTWEVRSSKDSRGFYYCSASKDRCLKTKAEAKAFRNVRGCGLVN